MDWEQLPEFLSFLDHLFFMPPLLALAGVKVDVVVAINLHTTKKIQQIFKLLPFIQCELISKSVAT